MPSDTRRMDVATGRTTVGVPGKGSVCLGTQCLTLGADVGRTGTTPRPPTALVGLDGCRMCWVVCRSPDFFPSTNPEERRLVSVPSSQGLPESHSGGAGTLVSLDQSWVWKG